MNLKKTGFALGATFTGLTYALGRKVYESTFHAKPHQWPDHGLSGRLKEFSHQPFMVENAQNGYLIETHLLKANVKSPNIMIIVHGLKCSYLELLPVAFSYLDAGINVLLYNQRHTGHTGGHNFTFGMFERFDMDKVAAVARRLYPDGWVGIHGFSMGAATAAFHSELNEQHKQVDFYILDSPFHEMDSMLESSLENRGFPSFCRPYLKWSGNLLTTLKAHINYRDIQPIKALAKCSSPVLILHGALDKTCPLVGAELMYKAIGHSQKELKVFEERDHVEAAFLESEDYYEGIWGFIERYVGAIGKIMECEG